MPLEVRETAARLSAATEASDLAVLVAVEDFIEPETVVVFAERTETLTYLAEHGSERAAARAYWQDRLVEGEEPFDGIRRVLDAEPGIREGNFVYPKWATVDLSEIDEDQRVQLLTEFPDCGPGWLVNGVYEGPIVEFGPDGSLEQLKTVLI